jgi:uncharacterized small protein (DUF1192 family)
MIDEDDRRPARKAFEPRPLVGLSVEELEAYTAFLKAELVRVDEALAQRRAVRGAADAFFKRPAGAPDPD